MNTLRTAQTNAAPPDDDGAQPGKPGAIVPQVHVVAEPEIPAAPSARDSYFEVPDVTQLAKEVVHLSMRSDRLLKSVDTLLNLHESEKAQRQSLQSTLDRLIEKAGISTPVRSLEAVGSELRNGVSEDLKPLLNAIIELLELSVRRAPAAPAITPARSAATDASDSQERLAGHDNNPSQLPPEDLPGALPEILTKSVEELVGRRRARRPKTFKSKQPDTDGKERHTLFGGHRPHGWIPVTSSMSKP